LFLGEKFNLEIPAQKIRINFFDAQQMAVLGLALKHVMGD
jgi:hypothetical protein